ncbi:MAG: hypothetical protein WA970_20395 [Gammaproteobacteria bacterium]
MTTDPMEVDAALKRDPAPAKIPLGQDASQETRTDTMESPMEGADRQAIERGENEGMAVGPE